ncbi:dihydroneopterin aldolase [bacterium]|nr:dihydroneopterin aldolase [bacterium]
MLIRIKNLNLKTIIGVQPRERKRKQRVVLNIEMDVDGRKAVAADDIAAAVDYRAATKFVLRFAEASRFFLLESLATGVLGLLMQDGRVRSATVEADKPGALRHAESVSVTVSGKRPARTAGKV